jgi:NADH-quinone oxidoreductase E subunit
MSDVIRHQAALGRPYVPKPETILVIDELVTHYPVKEAALIPAMHLLQDEIKWLPLEAMDWIADRLEVPRVRVYGVAAFYTMFRRKPEGRLRLEVCTHLSCSLLGATHLLDYLCDKLGIAPGETTPDGRVTVTEVECLGSCGTAPVMLVNDRFYENLTPRKIDALLDRISLSAPPPPPPDKEGDNG